MSMTPTVRDAEPFDPGFLARQRQELDARRQAYLADLERLTASAQELADGRGATEIADEDGFGEVDTMNVEREQLLVVSAEIRSRLEEIDMASARMAAGAYGLCEDCGQPIAQARLEALPEATRCVACKSGAILRRR
jgi:RNA polymerase-binding transcription factor DksA